LLRTQYRCHPAIAAPANAAFYAGRLLDGVSAADRAPLLPGLPPVTLVAVPGGVEAYGHGRSTSNAAEAAAVARVAASLAAAGVPGSDVGVICFFRAQCAAVEAALRRGGARAADGAPAPSLADDPPTVATVDSFQGSEKEVIILTTAVTRATKFAADGARLCVALTRARRHLVIVAHPAALRGDAVLGRVAGAAGRFGGWA
jgi:superfamily I DNA and/or RNA helicase